MTSERPQGAVAWRDPINGDTERIARDAAAYRAKFCSPMPASARLSVAREEDA